MNTEEEIKIKDLKLSLYMLLKVFKNAEKTKEQQMYYDRAKHISDKYHDIKDILRQQSDDQ